MENNQDRLHNIKVMMRVPLSSSSGGLEFLKKIQALPLPTEGSNLPALFSLGIETQWMMKCVVTNVSIDYPNVWDSKGSLPLYADVELTLLLI